MGLVSWDVLTFVHASTSSVVVPVLHIFRLRLHGPGPPKTPTHMCATENVHNDIQHGTVIPARVRDTHTNIDNHVYLSIPI